MIRRLIFALIICLTAAVSASAQVGGAPLMEVTPDAINFGQTTLGQTRTDTFTIRNNSSIVAENAVTINYTITLTSGQQAGFFISSPTTGTLGPGESTTVTVGFTPNSVGIANGSVTVDSNVGSDVVSLTGEGVDNNPVLEVTPESINFGQTELGETRTAAITLRNTVSRTQSIQYTVNLSSGLQAGFFIDSPNSGTIPPGQSVTVIVGFRPNNTGIVNGSVSVNSNFGSDVVNLTGEGVDSRRGFLSAQPLVVDFGTIDGGDSRTRTITLTNTGTAPISFSAPALRNGSNPAFFISSRPGTLSLNPGESTSFDVGFRPAAASAGAAFGSVDIFSNGGNVTITLRGNTAAQPRLDVQPTTIDFGNVDVGSTIRRLVTVSNTGGGTLNFNLAPLSGNGFFIATPPAATRLAAGESTTFEVGFTPASGDPAAGSIAVQSNGGNATVGLRGQGARVPQPRLLVEPTAIDFGSLNLGESRTGQFTVRNGGDADLIFNAIALDNVRDFEIGSARPARLVPGESATITVTFTPTGNGIARGVVAINSNGGSGSVVLTGAASARPQPVIDVEQTTLDFGDVLTGERRTLTFTIRNSAAAGAAPLEVGDIEARATGGLNRFEIVDAPAGPIPAGSSARISVSFAPEEIDTAAGSSAEINVSTNAGTPMIVTARGRGIVRLQFSERGTVRVREGEARTVNLSLQGRPPAGGLTVALSPRLEGDAGELVLNQNLLDLLNIEQSVLSTPTVTFTTANEQRPITIFVPDLEVGPPVRLSVGLAAGNNTALELAPLTIVVRPDDSPDLLSTFNCDGCRAGFTQQDDELTVIISYFDRNRDVARLVLQLRNDRGETIALPVFTTETQPGLPVGARGFSLRLRLRNLTNIGTIESINVLIQDADGNTSFATLPDSAE